MPPYQPYLQINLDNKHGRVITFANHDPRLDAVSLLSKAQICAVSAVRAC